MVEGASAEDRPDKAKAGGHPLDGRCGSCAARRKCTAKLYWKGKKAKITVTEKELSEISRRSLRYLEKDDKKSVVDGCEEFMKKFPDSALIPDVKKTLDLVKVEAVKNK